MIYSLEILEDFSILHHYWDEVVAHGTSLRPLSGVHWSVSTFLMHERAGFSHSLAALKAMSIVLLHQISTPGAMLWIPKNVNIRLAYWSLSIAVNVIITLTIIGSLVYMRFRVRQVRGPYYYSSDLTVSAMLIESAFLYTAFGLCFLIPLAANTNASYIFLQAFPQVQVSIPDHLSQSCHILNIKLRYFSSLLPCSSFFASFKAVQRPVRHLKTR